MIFYLPWLPDFSYFEHKIKSPFNLDKALGFLKRKISDDEIFQSNEYLFWILILLSHIDKLDLVDEKAIKKYISGLKYHKGGYKFSDKFEEPDIWSTFYCIASLKLLELDDLIEDDNIEFIKKSQSLGSGGDGGFFHCSARNCYIKCDRKTSVKSSFFALSTLKLLEKLDEIDREQLIKYLKKSTLNNIDLIYQILSLKILNAIDNNILKKEIPIILSWQKLRSGFAIESKVPSIENNFWPLICLEFLKKLDLIDFGGVLGFIRSMEEFNGGFTEQYTSLSQNVPNIRSTAQALLCILFVWKRLIELIENEILIQLKDSSEIDLTLISDKFSIPVKFVKDIADWMITNKWIDGKIFNREKRFNSYFNRQNAITQEIINEIIGIFKNKPEQKRLNLIEFSKSFDFSNALERVKLVVNDLIINKFLIGNITTQKRETFLDNVLVLREYIRLNKPITTYVEIMDEKKRLEDAKDNLLNLHTKLTNFLRKSSVELKILIDQEKISDTKKKFHDNCEYVDTQIQKYEKLINQINSDHIFINSKLLNLKFDKYWPFINSSIEKCFSTFKSEIDEKIKKKEEFITERLEKARNQEAIKSVEKTLHDIEIELIQYGVQIKDFFQKNYTNHKKALSQIKTISDYIKKSDSSLRSKISKKSNIIKFDEFKKELNELKILWTKRRKESKKVIQFYQNIINKREELEKYIADNVSLLQKFSDDVNKQITSLIKKNEIEEASNILNKSIKEFTEMSSNKNEIFYVSVDQINQEISEFPKFSSDIKALWNKKLEDQKSKWANVTLALKKNLYLGKESDKKDELEQDLKENIGDIKDFVENIKKVTHELIKKKYITDAENKIRETYIKITKKIDNYNQKFKDFIKTSTTEFKSFRETVKDLVENWEKEKINLIILLNKARDELLNEIENTTSTEKKGELRELIKTYVSNLETNINQLKSSYNQFIQSGKRLSEFESKLQAEMFKVRDSLKLIDNQIKNFIKKESRIYESFHEIIEEELELWNNSKLSIEKNFETVINRIEEDIFINKLQFFVKAFKDNKVSINYLSKVLNMKLEPLKMKLITFISNSKLKGKLDSNADMFILEEELVPKEFSVKGIKGEEIKEEIDPIKRDILNLRYLIVIQNKMGASVFNRKLGEWYMDSELIGGFLTAIQDFSSEIKQKKIPIKRMEYKDFEIILEQGKYTFAALFIDGEETDWIRNKLQLFVEEFEKVHEKSLKHWSGELGSFRDSSYLIDKVFELYRL
ncbi:MAG: hypothetical protein ACFE8A_02830 [Candidatus Hodarchaeota archaeon]